MPLLPVREHQERGLVHSPLFSTDGYNAYPNAPSVAWWLGTRETVRCVKNVRCIFEGNANEIISTREGRILKC